MTDKVSCEFFLVINADGEWDVCKDRDDAIYNVEGPIRVIKLTAAVAKALDQQISFEIPDNVGVSEQTDVEAA